MAVEVSQQLEPGRVTLWHVVLAMVFDAPLCLQTLSAS